MRDKVFRYIRRYGPERVENPALVESLIARFIAQAYWDDHPELANLGEVQTSTSHLDGAPPAAPCTQTEQELKPTDE